jgi:hypothetical protein
LCGELTDLVSDHCHSTTLLRDHLCSPCNLGLGHFRDNPEALRKAADYIERHRESHAKALQGRTIEEWAIAEYRAHWGR